MITQVSITLNMDMMLEILRWRGSSEKHINYVTPAVVLT